MLGLCHAFICLVPCARQPPLLPTSVNSVRVSPARHNAAGGVDWWAALPPSPFALIACPAMLFFLVAFYLLHGLVLLLLTKGSSQIAAHTSKVCPELLDLAQQTGSIALMMLGVHLAKIGPNLLRASMRAAVAPAASPPTAVATVKQRSCSRFLGLLLLRSSDLVLWLCWTGLLLLQLAVNWQSYVLVDRQLDVLRAAQLAEPGATLTSETSLLALTPGQSSSSMCGSAGSMHLIRWSLLCVIITSGVAISLLLVVTQDAMGAAWSGIQRWRRKSKRRGALAALWRCCTRSARHLDAVPAAAGSTRAATGTPTKQWLDMQTDEIAPDADEQA